MTNSEERHNQLVDIIQQRLQDQGWHTRKMLNYFSMNGNGEVDLYGSKNGYLAVFEMKSSYRPKSYKYAKQQLWRADNNLFHMTPQDTPRSIFNFVAYFNGPKKLDYTVKWIRHLNI